MSVCVVSMAIGEKYLDEYNRNFRPSQENYAKKHGYDFRVVTDYLGEVREPSTISLNKILVCSQDWSLNYDFIVFVDADILINPEAPPIHSCMDFGDKIGIVDEFTQPSFQKRVEFNRRMNWEPNASLYYRRSGFVLQTDKMLNTGVIVMQPKKHGTFLKGVYDKYIQKSVHHPRHFHYEQSAIGYELHVNNLFVVLPNTWNSIWYVYRYENMSLEQFSKKVNFLHFAGMGANSGQKSYNINALYK
jgi:glycosyltransferase involved in cell wall biosynthesis